MSNLAAIVVKDARKKDKCCARITIDVKNASSYTKWSKILGMLKYLVCITADFLIDRFLCYDSDRGLKSYRTICGIELASVVCLTLYLVKY